MGKLSLGLALLSGKAGVVCGVCSVGKLAWCVTSRVWVGDRECVREWCGVTWRACVVACVRDDVVAVKRLVSATVA